MRDRDRPDEVFEEEDITLSLPRRLGLSEVVRVQINRFEGEVRQRRQQVASQVEDLFRLVIRRPDADEIFLDAGERVANHYWAERSEGLKRFIALLPRPLALIAAQRAGRRMFRELVGPTRVKIGRRPVSLRIEQSLSARADPGGAACALYSGAFARLLELYTGRRYRVSHPVCATRGAGQACEWFVEVAT
jgi:predicted hydrocarbon binding protein